MIKSVVNSIIKDICIDINSRRRGQSWGQLIYILRSGVIWYKRETNNAMGYFALSYSSDSGGTWEELFNIDLTEDDVVIDLTHVYRHRIVGTSYRVDRELTPTGYTGEENTDWENIYLT